jgi:cation diffusion facilitator family transporter
MAENNQHIAEREKRGAALSSVLAAIFLTGMKLVVGLLTNSLGILAEAAHSGLDLVAAAITFAAVRISDRKPDPEHPYGYGKVENLSALVETLLLFITCIWIIYEAIQRLFFRTTQVEASIWSFIVMAVSIVVDITRSRLLMKMAIKHNSQALEADALHFSTDVWSSSVVIAGLAAIAIADLLEKYTNIQARWLHSADALAALGVSGIVIYVSFKLGKRTIAALVDRAPQGKTEEIAAALKKVEGILEVQRIRVRHSGPAIFTDVTISIPRSATFEEAHLIATKAEKAVERIYPNIDVMVHVDPISHSDETLIERLWGVAALRGLTVHSTRAYDLRGKLLLEMHVEVPETLKLAEAHGLVTDFERDLRIELPYLTEVVTHIEPVGEHEALHEATQVSVEKLHQVVNDVISQIPALKECHNIRILKDMGKLSVSIHCVANPDMPVIEAHQLSQTLESMLRERVPELERVIVHLEPPEEMDH